MYLIQLSVAIAILYVLICNGLNDYTSFPKLSYNGETKSYDIQGYMPSDTSKSYPLFMWITGTHLPYWNEDDKIITNWMAQRGVVAVSIDYPGTSGNYPQTCNAFKIRAETLFNMKNENSALSKLCSTSFVDCSKGVILSGFSQGANLISMAQNYANDDIIKGIYEIGGGDMQTNMKSWYNAPTWYQGCLSYSTLNISKTRIRSMVGENDETFGVNKIGVKNEQISITGYNNMCKSDIDCIQSDGSGWYIVEINETYDKHAPHCYMYQDQCGPNFDQNYYSSNGDNVQYQKVWTFQSNYQWLINKVVVEELDNNSGSNLCLETHFNCFIIGVIIIALFINSMNN